MDLKDWIENVFPLPKKFSWQKIFEDPALSFMPKSTGKIFNLLEECFSIEGIENQIPNLLPIMLSSGEPEVALTNLIEFSKAYRERNNSDFKWNRPEVKFFIYIFGRSNFLSNRLIRNPEIANELINSSYLFKKKNIEKMEYELEKRVEKQKNFSTNEFKNILRCYKYEEYLRITVRDLAKLCPLDEIFEELSNIAICCLRAALQHITKKEFFLRNNFHKINGSKTTKKTRRATQSKLKSLQLFTPFTILGMGKLGGYELNYSSDIDLIFVHDNEKITGDNEQDYKIRIKAARKLIDIMSDVTEEGFLARMDIRLRPGGDRSPLIQSVDEMELYYSSRGEIWERQAMIKATTIAGNNSCGENFFKMIKPFVFRSLLDETVLKDVEKIKNRIENEHLRESNLNVKLGIGGIREIEFFVQTFQLLYGGIKPKLRNPSTLEALKILGELKLVPQTDVETLKKAYLFLRNVEHHLQLREEQQTHTLPSNFIQQAIIARNLGYHDLDFEKARNKFLSDLKDIMSKVRSIFSGLFSRKHLEIEASILQCSRIKNFTHEEKKYIELFSQHLAPIISEKTKNKFQRLFDSINIKIDYYKKLSTFPSLLSRLTRIAETSEMLWNYMLNHLDLLEELDNSKLEISESTWSKQISEKLKSCINNEEEEIDQLRQFKHKNTFLLGSAELEGVLSYERTRAGLTILAEIILKAAFHLSLRSMTQRYGVVKNSQGEPGQFAIIGLGKLGGSELTYFSDLDLIFIHSGNGLSDGSNKISAQEYWVKLIQRLISFLSTITRNGFAYKLDTRLRPSGNAGVLVTPFDIYIKYHKKSQPWEHQALIKGRLIGGKGEKKWFKKVEEEIKKAVFEWTPPENIDSQINHLRLRKEIELSHENNNQINIKEGKGGLLDIEYLTQSMQLKHGKYFPQLQCTKTIDALKYLGELNLISKIDSESLKKNYKFLRLIENGLRLINDDSTNLLDFGNVSPETILQLLKNHGYNIEDLKESLQKTTKNVRKIYLKYF